MSRYDQVLLSAADAVGDTPLVELSRVTRACGVKGRLLAKLEYLNPGLSKKDRIARQIIEDAEASGALRPGQTVVELTSGNTGIGLAIICAIKGYPFVAVISRGNSPERARMMCAFGAEVVLVDQAPGSVPGQVSGADLVAVEETAARLTAERGAFRADQFKNPANFRAYYLYAGPELIRQTGGRIDAFCDFVGTGGGFAGMSAALKAHNPAIRCYVVEPAGAAALAGQPVTEPKHRIQGGGYAMAPLELIRPEHLVDGYVQVRDDDAIATTRQLAKLEGIFGGYSGGANVAAAINLLREAHHGQTVAVMIPDSGLKYLSTDLWE